MLPDISRDKQLAILRRMLMIRRAEEHCIRFNDEHTVLIRGASIIYRPGSHRRSGVRLVKCR